MSLGFKQTWNQMLVSCYFSVWLWTCCLTMMSIVLFIYGPRMVRHTSQMVRRTEMKICVVCLVDQSCLILCKPMDCSPPGSSVHGILQARMLEWVAIPFSRGSSWHRGQTCVSCISRQILYHWANGKPFLVHNRCLLGELISSVFPRIFWEFCRRSTAPFQGSEWW